MVNPWLSLPRRSPHVLPQDWPAIKRFNDDLSPSKSPCRIHVEGVLPEPFAGAVKTAPVLMLLLNPGFKESKRELHLKPEFKKALLRNLRHKEYDWPFYFFDPRFDRSKGEYPGVALWNERTHELAEAVGLRCCAIAKVEDAESAGRRVLAKKLAVVEWFPYRSEEFCRKCEVDSRHYGFSLVENAISRGALIIIGRSKTRWEKSVASLVEHDRVLTLSNSQRPWLTKNNVRFRSEPNSKARAWKMLLNALC